MGLVVKRSKIPNGGLTGGDYFAWALRNTQFLVL